MGENVYVEVVFPAMSKRYDFVLPVKLRVQPATRLISQIIMNKERLELDVEKLLLFNYDGKVLIDSSMSVYEAGINDGSRLILV